MTEKNYSWVEYAEIMCLHCQYWGPLHTFHQQYRMPEALLVVCPKCQKKMEIQSIDLIKFPPSDQNELEPVEQKPSFFQKKWEVLKEYLKTDIGRNNYDIDFHSGQENTLDVMKAIESGITNQTLLFNKMYHANLDPVEEE